jgi:hypothetical protein
MTSTYNFVSFNKLKKRYNKKQNNACDSDIKIRLKGDELKDNRSYSFVVCGYKTNNKVNINNINNEKSIININDNYEFPKIGQDLRLAPFVKKFTKLKMPLMFDPYYGAYISSNYTTDYASLYPSTNQYYNYIKYDNMQGSQYNYSDKLYTGYESIPTYNKPLNTNFYNQYKDFDGDMGVYINGSVPKGFAFSNIETKDQETTNMPAPTKYPNDKITEVEIKTTSSGFHDKIMKLNFTIYDESHSVGITSSLAIGEPLTQSTLSNFHATGIDQYSPFIMEEVD